MKLGTWRVGRCSMSKHEIDCTESKQFKQFITHRDNSVTVLIMTKNTKTKLVLSGAVFAELIADGTLIIDD